MADVSSMFKTHRRAEDMLGGWGQNALQNTDYWQSQLGLMNQLSGMAAGTSGPSAAESMFRQSLDQAQKAAMAQAASTRGINPVMAARVGASTGAEIAGQGAAQAAALRAQEQQQAIQLLQMLTGQMGGQMSQTFQEGQLTPYQLIMQGQAGIKQTKAGKSPWYENMAANLLPGAVGGLMQGVGGGLVQGGGT
jgi:hypothetical protein